MNLLLISNSTNYGEPYLAHAKPKIKAFLGEKILYGLFIPYAAVTFSYNAYEAKVRRAFIELGYDLVSIHKVPNPLKAIHRADFIVVGGGNTFKLLHELQQQYLLEPIREKVLSKRAPYIGWSAGANLACPTIMTTNDMPIVQPENFKALGFVNFQINPHYTNKKIEGHGGESRDDRLLEFVEMNRNIFVVGLPEGTALSIRKNKIELMGDKPAKIFKYGLLPYEVEDKDGLNFLL